MFHSVSSTGDRKQSQKQYEIYSLSFLYKAQVLAHLTHTPIMGTRHERNGMLPCILKHKWLKHLKPNYIHFKTSGNKLQDKKTTANALRFKINQEIKFLYCKKQNLNTQLYHLHLECANYCNSAWQHTGCPRRNVKYFGRVFLMLNYTDITQNT